MIGESSSEYPADVTDAAPASLRPNATTRIGAWRHGLAFVCLLGAAGGVYLNAGHTQFFFDSMHITHDPVITHLGEAIRECFASGLKPGQDFSRVTFAANYGWNLHRGVDGYDPTSYLIVNVALHGVTSCMVYLVALALLRWTADPRWGWWCALVASILFAVHPLHVASVVYIVQRRGILTTLFYLLSIWGFIRACESVGGKRLAWICVTALSGILCIKSKTMGLTLPLALWTLHIIRSVYVRGRVPKSVIAGTLAIGAFTALAGYLVLHGTLKLIEVMPVSIGLWDQFLTQLRAIAAMLGLVLLPLNQFLSVDHLFSISRSIADPAVLASLALHVCMIWFAIRSIRRGRPALGFGLLLFYISFLPWLLIAQSEQLVEYKSYLGVAALLIALASILARLQSRATRVVAVIALLLVATGLATATVHRNAVFKDPITLWTDVLKKSPAHFRARVSLGYSLAQNRRFNEAMQQYRLAVALDPYNATLHYYMGNSLREMGKVREAIEEFREGRRIAGGDLHIAINLGNALSSLGYMDEAVDAYRKGLTEAAPGTDRATIAQAHVSLGNALGTQKQNEQAAAEYRAAIEASPGYAKAYYGLGVVLDQLGRRDEAVENLYVALRLDPSMKAAEELVQEILGKKATGP